MGGKLYLGILLVVKIPGTGSRNSGGAIPGGEKFAQTPGLRSFGRYKIPEIIYTKLLMPSKWG